MPDTETDARTTEIPVSPRDPFKPELAIRVLAMPADTNAAGDIFGGWLMSQVDIAGSIAAYDLAGGRVVTVAVNAFRFLKPVYVGDLVSCYSWVTEVGNSSIEVRIDVYIERNRNADEVQKVATAVLTYVAIDDKGRPRSAKRRSG